jgi:hypothetical protein
MPLFVCVWWMAALGAVGKAAAAMKMGGAAAAAKGGIMAGMAGKGAAAGAAQGAGASSGIIGQAAAQGASGGAGPGALGSMQGSQGVTNMMSGGPMKQLPWFSKVGESMKAGPSASAEASQAAAAPQQLAVSPGTTPPQVPSRAYGTSATAHTQPGWWDKAKGYYDKYQSAKEQLPEEREPQPLQIAALPNYPSQSPQQQGPAWAQWMDRLRAMQASGGIRR